VPVLTDLPTDREVFLRLEPEELGLAMLNIARKNMQHGTFHPGANIPIPGELLSGSVDHQRVERALSEAWDWLRRQGLILPVPGINGVNGHMMLSRRAEHLITEATFDQFREAARFPKSLLHQKIADKVWIQLARGEFQDAVFYAFRTVEECVRAPSGLH